MIPYPGGAGLRATRADEDSPTLLDQRNAITSVVWFVRVWKQPSSRHVSLSERLHAELKLNHLRCHCDGVNLASRQAIGGKVVDAVASPLADCDIVLATNLAGCDIVPRLAANQ